MTDESTVASTADALIASQETILASGALNDAMKESYKQLFAEQRAEVVRLEKIDRKMAIERALHYEQENISAYREMEKAHHESMMDMIDAISDDDDDD